MGADNLAVRRSVILFAAAGFLVAAAAGVFGLWLPAWRHDRDAAWAAAGGRALVRVQLPASFATVQPTGRIRVCNNSPAERCLLGPGDPPEQLATVKAALAAVATGPVTGACHPVPLPGSPPSCHLEAPVAGSRLVADLFAHASSQRGPLSQWRYSGTYVLLHLGGR